MNQGNSISRFHMLRSLFTKDEIVRYFDISSSINYKTHYNKFDFNLFDYYTYSMPILCRDADQFGMANSIEIRSPLLDTELKSFVNSIGIKRRLKGVFNKQMLIDSFEDVLPREVYDRDKMGFSLPWDKWIRNELSAEIESSINQLAERMENPNLQRLWDDYLIGRITYAHILSVYVLSQWTTLNNVEFS